MKPMIVPNPVYSNRRNVPWNMNYVHAHLEHELYFLEKGEAYYFIGDKIFPVHENAFVFIHKGVLHKTMYDSLSCVERTLLKPDSEFFSLKPFSFVIESLTKKPVNYVPSERLSIFRNLFEKIENLSSCQGNNNKLLVNIYTAEILTLLSEYGITDPETDSSSGDILINSVQKYISQNYSNSITLSEISAHFSVSEEHLSRRFKQKTGICISEFINYQRISHAAELLKNSNITVTGAAEKCGFNDSNYFSTVFKKVMGISPKQYSIQNKQNNN